MEKLIIALFPIIGCFYQPSFKKYLLFATGIPLFLLLVVWTSPYHYSISWLDDLLLLILLSGIWGLAVSHTEKKSSSYFFSGLLALVLAGILFILTIADAFSSYTIVLKHWEKYPYQVNHIQNAGFSGRPSYYYQLQKHTAFGLLEATLDHSESMMVPDSLCNMELFDKLSARMVRFDKCKETIILPD